MSPIVRRLLCALLVPALSTVALAQSSADSTLETDLLDILKEKGVITADQYDSLLAAAHKRAEARSNELTLIDASLQRLAAPDVQARGGQPGKLVFRSPDGKWTMGLRGEIQARVEHTDSNDPTKDDNNISVPRARLTVEGTAGAPNIRYKLQLDASTNSKPTDPATEPAATPRDVYVDWGFLETNSLRLGQFKFPFGREQLTSTSQIDLQELSIATNEFTPSYEPAAMVSGLLADGMFEYQAAMSNGEGRGKNNTPGETKNGMRAGARVVWNPLGAFKLDGPAFQTVDDGSTKLGVGAALMRNEDSSGLNTVTPGANTETSDFEAGLDSGPLAVLAEAFHRTTHAQAGGDTIDDGRNFQLGYLFDAARFELVGRYSSIDYGAKDDQFEKTVGVNWYVDRHNAKWMADFSKLSGQGSTPDTNRLRLQFQVLF